MECVPGDIAHSVRPGLVEERREPANEVLYGGKRRYAAGSVVGDAYVRELRPRRLLFRYRSRLGRVAGQRRRRKQVLEFERHLRFLGRLRRLVRPRPSRDGRLRRAWLSSTPVDHLSIRKKGLHFERPIRTRKHFAIRGGSVRPSAPFRKRPPGQLARVRLL